MLSSTRSMRGKENVAVKFSAKPNSDSNVSQSSSVTVSFYKSPKLTKTSNNFSVLRSQNCEENQSLLKSLGIENKKPKRNLGFSSKRPETKKRARIDDSDESGEESIEMKVKKEKLAPRESSKRAAAAGSYSEMFSFKEESDEEAEWKGSESPAQPSPGPKYSSLASKAKVSKENFFAKKPKKFVQGKVSYDKLNNEEKISLESKSPKRNRHSAKVSKEMLDNVCYSLDKKEASSARRPGSTCHQCLEVTCDTKTLCRSFSCTQKFGYCGVCLSTWFGEDAKESLLDIEWECPACRGECQCKGCRKSRNLPPLPRHVLSTSLVKGFASVAEYLKSLEENADKAVEAV